ncbi:MAG: radical SAM protein [Frankiaceae bacterium]
MRQDVTFLAPPRRRVTEGERHQLAIQVQERIFSTSRSIPEAISDTALYFRVSIVGNCNLHCQFCHNEGGPDRGTMSLESAGIAFGAAANAGFRRLQLTGGEPLIHRQVDDLVRLGRQFFPDVGVTTNGVFLPKKLESLLAASVSRLHVSLQAETLIASNGTWQLPPWLTELIERCAATDTVLRFNLPVGVADLDRAAGLLSRTAGLSFDVNIFALLSDEAASPSFSNEYLSRLQALARAATQVRDKGRVQVRSYRTSQGLRCGRCSKRASCTEQSRSLRLGVDNVLRPCLATRDWDFAFRPSHGYEDMEIATLLALDFVDWAA